MAIAVIGMVRHSASQRGRNEELHEQLEEKVVAISRSDARFRHVFDGIADGVAVVDRATILTSVNAALAELLEQPAEALIGRPATDFLLPADSQEAHRRRHGSRRRAPPRHDRVARGIPARSSRSRPR